MTTYLRYKKKKNVDEIKLDLPFMVVSSMWRLKLSIEIFRRQPPLSTFYIVYQICENEEG